MINVVMIIIKAIIVRFISVIQLIIIHFGINPRNGGRPPNDKKLIMNDNLINLFWFIELFIWLMWYEFDFLNIMIMFRLIIV
jgi:hypothetical protein